MRMITIAWTLALVVSSGCGGCDRGDVDAAAAVSDCGAADAWAIDAAIDAARAIDAQVGDGRPAAPTPPFGISCSADTPCPAPLSCLVTPSGATVCSSSCTWGDDCAASGAWCVHSSMLPTSPSFSCAWRCDVWACPDGTACRGVDPPVCVLPF